MKSIYAVIAQITLSASNFLVYMIFTSKLDSENFILFSTSVGLSVLAYAIAEGGISYVAPKVLTSEVENTHMIASCFVFVSLLLYSLSILLGYYIWNMVSDSPLSVSWVVSYSLYFIPVMLFPSWLTFKSIKINHVIMLWVVRAIGLIYIFLYPTLESLVLVSIVNMVMTVFLLFLMNKDEKIISYPTLSGIYFVINMLKEVFVSKTLSFVIYSSIPMIIAAIYGNSSSALYILGERLKSMYSTLFQPIIQTLYLWGFDKKNNINISNKSLISMLIGLNLLVAITVYLILKTDIIYQYINRLKDVIDVNLYIIAAFLSVMTSILLYFIVFPKGYYKLFRLATYFQLIVFVILFVIAKISISLPASYILTIGELSIFICISSQLFINSKNKKVLK